HTRFSRDWSSDVCSSDLDAELDNDQCIGAIAGIRELEALVFVDSDGKGAIFFAFRQGAGAQVFDFYKAQWFTAAQFKHVAIEHRSEERRVGKEWRSRWRP